MVPSKSLHFDVVFASDIFVLGGTNAVLAGYADYFFEKGIRLAVLPMHLPHAKKKSAVYTRIRERINSGKIHVIEDHIKKIECGLFVVDNPSLFHTADPVPDISIEAKRRIVIVPFPPKDGRGLTYDPLYVLNAASRVSQGAYRWAPVSPLVRKQFTEMYPYLPLTSSDVRPILDPGRYRPRKEGWPSGKIVAGRHSRPHAEKWPKGRKNFLRIYPDDRRIDVHLLGIRSDQLRTLIGKIPDNYRLYGYNETSVSDFLHELDFFVYFNNPWWVEALGIVVLEAMLSKVPCILPAYMRENFGAHAIYPDAANPWPAIRSSLKKPEALRTMVDEAFVFASETYSKQTFAAWLAEIGFEKTPAHAPQRTRVEACHLIDLHGNGILQLSILERIARSAEQGDDVAVIVDEISELSPYARAFLRERNIPLLDASAKSKIETSKLHLYDPFASGAARMIQHVTADEVELNLSEPPDVPLSQLFGLVTGNVKLKLRTSSEAARIWAEDEWINRDIQDLHELELTSRTIELHAARRKHGTRPKHHVGVFCDGIGTDIEEALSQANRTKLENISIYDAAEDNDMNVMRWLSRLAFLYVVTNQDELELTLRHTIKVANALSVPMQLVSADDERGIADILRTARIAINA